MKARVPNKTMIAAERDKAQTDAIVSCAYEWQPDKEEKRGAYFEGAMSSICAVIGMESEEET